MYFVIKTKVECLGHNKLKAPLETPLLYFMYCIVVTVALSSDLNVIIVQLTLLLLESQTGMYDTYEKK